MKRFILFTSLLALIMLTLAIRPSGVPAAPIVTFNACTDRCDQARTSCQEQATAVYVNCGQQGGTQTQCQQQRDNAYNACMRSANCQSCYDPSMGITWYCNCGKPFGDGGDTKGTTIQTVYYYDPTDEANYNWYCESDPCLCDPTLAWCGL